MSATVGRWPDELYRGVREVLGEALSLGSRARDLKPESMLLGALPELDSHAVVTVLMALEERFDITIDDDDVDGQTFETLESLASLVADKGGSAGAR